MLIDTEVLPDREDQILFNVKYKKLWLQFSIEVGSESANFASELIKSEQGTPLLVI